MAVYQQPVIDALNAISASNDNAYARQRQEQLDAMAMRNNELAYNMNQLKYDEAKRAADYETGLKAYAQERMTPPQVANPAYSAYMDAASAGPPQRVVNNPDVPAELQDLTGEPQYSYKYPTPQGAMSAAPPQTVAGKAPSFLQIVMEYAQNQGNPESYQKFMEAAQQRSLFISKLVNPAAGVDAFNDLTGANLKYLGTKDNIIHVKDGEKIYAIDSTTGKPTLLMEGDPKGETWSDPYPAVVGGKKALVQKSSNGQIKPVIQDTSTTVKITNNGGDKADMYEKRAAFGELPKLRQDAQSASQAMPRINRMIQILDSGNAGGIKSTMQKMLAPYAPEAKNANESALFQIYARLVSGPQRVNIIGPGPQTDKEGELLALVGGGGTQGRAALRELLAMHKQGYISKIDEYNSMREAAGTKIYKPITVDSGATLAQSTSKPVKSGRFVVQEVR